MTNRMTMIALALAAVCLGQARVASAQMGVSAEGRLGVTFPVGELADAGAEAGLGFGAELMLTLQRNLTAYVGWSRHGFSCDAECSLGHDVRSAGFGAGLKYILPSPRDALLWGRAGVVGHQLSTSAGVGDRNVGFELGAGMDVPVAQRLFVVPHLGFISHGGSGVSSSYVNFGLGGHYHIW
jgi:hypothetical protein